MTILQAQLQSDRSKTPKLHKFRTLERAEVLALAAGSHALCVLNSGRVGHVKINGRVRTWQRTPGRIEVPIKYGMYEFAVFDLNTAMERFVVEVGEAE